MNTNQRFAIFCAKRCLHLWDVPEVVKNWLNDPKEEAAREVAKSAGQAAWAATKAAARKAAVAAWAAEAAGAAAVERKAAEAVRAAWAAEAVWAAAAEAAEALDTTEKELRLEFVSTWTDKQLATTDPEWIDYATVEIMNREY